MIRPFKPLFTMEFGYMKLAPKLRRLLHECRAKETTRYAIEGIHVDSDGLTATDGRRLIHVELKHKLKDGMHVLTQDGYMLPVEGMGNFPKWQEIVPKDNPEGKTVCTDDSQGISGVVYHFNQNKTLFNLDLFLPVLDILGSLDADVQVHKSKPGRPGHFTGTFTGAKFVFIIMPINL